MLSAGSEEQVASRHLLRRALAGIEQQDLPGCKLDGVESFWPVLLVVRQCSWEKQHEPWLTPRRPLHWQGGAPQQGAYGESKKQCQGEAQGVVAGGWQRECIAVVGHVCWRVLL